MHHARTETPPVGRPDFLGSLLSSAATVRRRAVEAFASWRNRREIVRLAGLEDRLLADIGVTRADVDWALMKPRVIDPSEALAGRVRRRRNAGRWARQLMDDRPGLVAGRDASFRQLSRARRP